VTVPTLQNVQPGTIAIYSDIACPWAHLTVHRLWEARQRLGAPVLFDHRPFALEIVNERPTPKAVLEAEVPVVAPHGWEAGWQMWQGKPWEWPVTSLLALEAVQAAKEQSLQASEALDRALRRAFFGDSRCISMRHVVLEVASKVDEVDEGALADALDAGRARAAVMEPVPDDVNGSPHLFLPDGSDVHNPGIDMHWMGDHGKGFPHIDADDPTVYDDLIRTAGITGSP
jgi:predicted DsbA family dithiol-disulfide isomerase